MMRHIPIIFVHKGNHFYLKNAIYQATLLNPESMIYLLGDESNRTLKEKNVQHFLLKDYYKLANKFAECYKHMNSNGYEYELFCIQRWFIIREFVIKHELSDFLYLDSDVLLYCDITKVLADKLSYEFTVCDFRVPNVTLMKQSSIVKFTDYIFALYTEKMNLELLQQLYKTFFTSDDKRIRMGGISDMTIMEFYQKYVSDHVLDLAVPRDGICFDGNIGISSGFKMKDGLKEVVWINDIPYGKYGESEELIRFGALHFQGRSKMKQHYYLLDKEKKHIQNIPFSIQWIIAKAWMNKVWSGIKKIDVMVPHFITLFRVKRTFKQGNK